MFFVLVVVVVALQIKIDMQPTTAKITAKPNQPTIDRFDLIVQNEKTN